MADNDVQSDKSQEGEYPEHQVPTPVQSAQDAPAAEPEVSQERVNEQTLLIEVESGDYPVSLAQVFAKHKASFPKEPLLHDLQQLGYAKVEFSPIPEGDVVTEGAPVLEDGVWVRTWKTRKWDEQEVDQVLVQRKAQAIEKVTAVRNDDFEMGMEYEVEGSDPFHVQLRTSEDYPNLLIIHALAASLIASGDEGPIKFRSYENVTVTLSGQQALEMTTAAFVAIGKIYQATWALKDQINQAQTLDELPQVPATFL